ncbi:MAG TPA: alpha/beta hydrolase [Azospirillaceae bacterium]|nr:alpha/beta hydrolase [Azospirillaceae bacterium]
MPLDQDTAALLRTFNESPGAPIDSQSVADIRAGLSALFTQLGGPPPSVGMVEEGAMPGPGGPLGYRLYRPRGQAAPELPLVLFLHGGGWTLGDLGCYDSFCRSLCRESDMLVLSLDYRLAPEHRYPAGLEDGYAALCWIAENARQLGVDPARIAVAGDSAGGTLAASICRLARDRGGPRPAAQLLLYPVLALAGEEALPSRAENGGGEYFLSGEAIAWAGRQWLGDRPEAARDPLVSPLLAEEFAGLADALVITAGYDPLRDEGRFYAEKLSAAGVPVEHVCFDGTIHAFLSFPAALGVARQGMERVGTWLKRKLA